MEALYREQPPWLMWVGTTGAGVLVTPRLVLTCDHVVPQDRVDVVQVHAGRGQDAFKSGASVVFRVPIAKNGGGDLAVLQLDVPVPNAVPAPLRAPEVMSGHRFRVQGFPKHGHSQAVGTLGPPVEPGWVQMDDDRGFGHVLERGYSGAPVWDDDAGAVVGIVVVAYREKRSGGLIPVRGIAEMWPTAAGLVGWRPDLDDAFESHWLPRAKGAEPVWAPTVDHFVGRARVLDELARYLAAPGDGRVWAVVGKPGSGKSAVLARTVLSSHWLTRDLVGGVGGPPLGSVTVAVHARGKTLGDVIAAIADAADVDARDETGLLLRCGPVSVVVDALDEAVRDEPRKIAVLLRKLADAGSRVVVALRTGPRGSASAEALGRLGSPVLLDLDSPDYLDPGDIPRYVARCLGDRPEADGVADRAGGNFLIAQLAVRTVLNGGTSMATTLSMAVDEYLDACFPGRRNVVRDLLRPLAFTEDPGLPADGTWLALANALSGAEYTRNDLREVRGAVGTYLVERHGAVFRLFHRALEDMFREEYPGPEPDLLVYRTLRGLVTGWEDAPEYVRDHLAAHAAAAGTVDEVLVDPGFLVAVPPLRLLPHLHHVRRAAGIAHVYRRVAHDLEDRDHAGRAASLALVAAQTDTNLPEFANPRWRTEVLAWNTGRFFEVLAQFPPGAWVDTWLDARGEPAALATSDGVATLYRYNGARLVPAERLPYDRIHLWAQHHLLMSDGTEVALVVDDDGTLRKWSLTDGFQEHGSIKLNGFPFEWDLDALVTPDGRLLVLAGATEEVFLVDFTTDSPSVLDRVTVECDGYESRPRVSMGLAGDAVHVAYVNDSTALTGRVNRSRFALTRTLPDEDGELPNSYRFVPGTYEGLLRLELTSDATHVHSVDYPEVDLRPVDGATAFTHAVSADGEVLAGSIDAAGRLSAWRADLSLNRVGETVDGPESPVEALTIGTGPDGRPIGLLLCEDNRLRLWDIEATPPGEVSTVRGFEPVTRVTLTDAGGRVVALTGTSVDDLATVTVEQGALVVSDRRQHATGDVIVRQSAAPGPVVTLLDRYATVHVLKGGEEARRIPPNYRLDLPDTAPVAIEDSGRLLIATAVNGGTLRCLEEEGGSWRLRSVHRPPEYDLRTDDFVRVESMGDYILALKTRITRMELVRAPDGWIGLLTLNEHGLSLFTVPAQGDMLKLDHIAPATWFNPGHRTETPLVLVLRDGALQLHAITPGGFEPWSEAWPDPSGPDPVLATTLDGHGHALIAVGDQHGRVNTWRCQHASRVRQHVMIDVHSRVVAMRWTSDHALLVWCDSGVLRLHLAPPTPGVT